MYVMTSDYGAPSQLEKIDMLDFAELVVLNKFDKRGAEDALRDVRKQWKRNRVAFKIEGRGRAGLSDDRQPVQRSRHHLDVRQPVPPAAREAARCRHEKWTPELDTTLKEPRATVLIPGAAACATSPRSPSRAAAINARDRQRRPRSPTARRRYWQSLHELGRRQAAEAPLDARMPPTGRPHRCEPIASARQAQLADDALRCASATTTPCSR